VDGPHLHEVGPRPKRRSALPAYDALGRSGQPDRLSQPDVRRNQGSIRVLGALRGDEKPDGPDVADLDPEDDVAALHGCGPEHRQLIGGRRNGTGCCDGDRNPGERELPRHTMILATAHRHDARLAADCRRAMESVNGKVSSEAVEIAGRLTAG